MVTTTVRDRYVKTLLMLVQRNLHFDDYLIG